jgi:hypothetical protein
VTQHFSAGFLRDDTTGALIVSGGGAPYGTLAARPAAATAGDQAFYYATDDNGGTLYQSQAGSWVAVAVPTSELGYVSVSSGDWPVTGILGDANWHDVPGLSVTVTGLNRPVELSLDCMLQIPAGASASTVTAGIWEGGTELRENYVMLPAASTAAPVVVTARLAAFTSSRTFKVAIKSNTGYGQVRAGASYASASLRAESK